MDINECLREIRALVEQINALLAAEDPNEEAADLGLELAGKVADLDEWLTRGGFLPNAWSNERTRR